MLELGVGIYLYFQPTIQNMKYFVMIDILYCSLDRKFFVEQTKFSNSKITKTNKLNFFLEFLKEV